MMEAEGSTSSCSLDEQKRISRKWNNFQDYLNELILSEEWRKVQEKRKPRKTSNKSIQTEQMPQSFETFSLIPQSKRKFRLHLHREKVKATRQHQELLQKQLLGMSVIQQVVEGFKARYNCHKRERDQKKLEEREFILQDLSLLLKVNTNYLSIDSLAVSKVMAYRKVRKFQLIHQRQQFIEIIQKILRECKRQKQIDDSNYYSMPTRQRKKKIYRSEFVITEEISLTSSSMMQMIDESNNEESLHESVMREDEPNDSGNLNSELQKPPPPPPKQKKAKSTKSDKENRSRKKGANPKLDEAEQCLVLPNIPVDHKHYKYTPEEYGKLQQDLRTNVCDYDKAVHAYTTFIEQGKDPSFSYPYANDNSILWQPPNVIFQHSTNNQIQQRKLKLTNKHNSTRYVRFYKTVLFSQWETDSIQVEPTGAQRIIPGLSTYITVRFQLEPIEYTFNLDGYLIFLTYSNNVTEYKQFHVPIKCGSSIMPAISLNLDEICFPSCPYWRISFQSKYLTITNTGSKACYIQMRKLDIDTADYYDTKSWPAVMHEEEIRTITFDQENSAISSNNVEEFSEFVNEVDNDDNLLTESADHIAQDIINSIINIVVFSKFRTSETCFVLPALTKHKIAFTPCNIEYAGDYVENYQVTAIYESRDIFSEDITIRIKATGSSISLASHYLDFGHCCLYNLYQLSFKLCNSASISHCVKIHIADELKTAYLWSNKTILYILPGQSQIVPIKFFPKRELCYLKHYFDTFTGVFQCDVSISAMNPDCLDMPPLLLPIYAILTEPNGLYFNTQMFYLGQISTHESVIVDVEVRNRSLVTQQFGVVNLSPSVTIMPNYGFGEIDSLDSQTLRLIFSPTLKDISNHPANSITSNRISIPVTLNTIPELASQDVKGELLSPTLYLEANIYEPACNLSHQYVVFPHTCSGSYSTMCITLEAKQDIIPFNCVCGYEKKVCIEDYQVHYEIVSSSREIRIEPTCGVLQRGEKVELILVCKPTFPDSIIQARQQFTTTTTSPEKQTRKIPIKSGNECENIPSTDAWLELMNLWRQTNPYQIDGHCTVSLSYMGFEKERPSETLYIYTRCNVVRPCFIHNVIDETLNFGPVVLGTAHRKILSIKNITYASIQVSISLLNPIGPYTCLVTTNIQILPEHVVQIPITFAPTHHGKAMEYFEVKAQKTIVAMSMIGEGTSPSLVFSPTFSIARLESVKGKNAILTIDLKNEGQSTLQLTFVKLFELEGTIMELPSESEAQPSSKKKTKAKKIKKPPKFSNELTAAELHSIKTFTQRTDGAAAYFNMMQQSAYVNVLPLSKLSVKITFGDSNVVESGRGKGKKSSPSKKKKDAKQANNNQIIYLAKYNVMLNNTTLMKEFILLASFK